MENRLNYFLGKPVEVNGVKIYSPTIDEIVQIGEIKYNIYLSIATFNKEVVYKSLLNLDDSQYDEIADEDAYDLFILPIPIRNELINALNFFTHEQVEFDYKDLSFKVGNKKFINKDNYLEVANIIKESNGILEEEKRIKFKGHKAKLIYEKLKQLREKYKKDDGNTLELKDMLSILCNADGNGINIFNVGKLTIYQVYEHFERLNIKEKHTRLLRVWANGYLSKDEQLPEWIVKTKY